MDQQTPPVNAGQTIHARLETRNNDSFAEGERLGLMLAAKVRTIALLLILLWRIVDNPHTGLVYLYDVLEVASFVFLGVLQYIFAKQRIGMPFLKYVFVLIDCMLLAFVISTPNLILDSALPAALAMESSRSSFFLIFLVQSAFSLRPQLVLWCGLCIVAARTSMLIWFLSKPDVYSNLSGSVSGDEAFLIARPDLNYVHLGHWNADIAVTLILAAGLAVVVNRSRRLVESRMIAERTRAALARYFSPNVIDHLSDSRQLLGSVREQQVAVLFADIMGFTKLCENTSPEGVIAILREYHNRLGQTVFDNDGTLDKYIGDGLMATFGTPEPGSRDAINSLQCAMDMIVALEKWNAKRRAEGAAPVCVGIGIHYGSVVAGDMGNERRLEYTVIGDTVNIASRLEQLTRTLDTPLVVSDSLIKAIAQSDDADNALLDGLSEAGVQKIRGRESGVAVWTLSD
jgi:adenylate cyclase